MQVVMHLVSYMPIYFVNSTFCNTFNLVFKNETDMMEIHLTMVLLLLLLEDQLLIALNDL